MQTRFFRWLVLALTAFVLSGCRFYGEVDWKVPRYTVSGTGDVEQLRAPLVGAYVDFDGPVYVRVETDRTGRYRVNLPKGRYDVTVRALHDDYTTWVWVDKDGVLDLRVSLRSWYQPALFEALSGIRQYYFDGGGRLTWRWGELVRWEQPVVYVYFDTYNAPAAAYTWSRDYLRFLNETLGSLFKGRVRFQETLSRAAADIEVFWARAGTLPQSAITTHVRYHQNGALDLVRIQIDERWGADESIWKHELIRALGVSYSYDEYSLLYPALLPGQRTSLSTAESRHIQLMYDLPSGLSATGYWGLQAYGASLDTVAGPDGAGGGLGELNESRSTGYSGYARLQDGRVVELAEHEAAAQIFAW